MVKCPSMLPASLDIRQLSAPFSGGASATKWGGGGGEGDT